MRTTARRLLVPALAALTLTVSGCSTEGQPDAAPAAPSVPVSVSPGATPGSDTSRELEVTPAQSGSATPAAVARSGRKVGQGAGAQRSALKVASYDSKTRRAVISAPPQGGRNTSGPTGPDASPTAPGTGPDGPTASPDAPGTGPDGPGADTDGPGASPDTPGKSPASPGGDAPVAPGDIIASAPAPGAPDGLLAEVTEVLAQTGQGTEVATRPTTLAALLDDDKAEGRIPVDPSSVDVEPLLKGVKFSWAKPGGARFGPNAGRLPLGSLRLDVGTSVATAEGAPVSASASVSGFVQLAPEVAFSYDGSSGQQQSQPDKQGPGAAFLGLSGDWTSQWSFKGRAAAAAEPLRIPFAKLHADPVIQVGPVPVVVNLDLTCYLQVEADGRVTLDVTQDVKGDFRFGGSYAPATGWTPVAESQTKSSPVTASVTAAGQAKAVLGAEASVGLYGTVGVTADFAPYVRAGVTAGAEASVTGGADASASASAAWRLHGGFALSGHLQLQLSVFGTPVLSHRIPLGRVEKEWLLTDGEVGVATS
ncbi:hypothetical protein [Streptomyces sp. PR69]|uniref:hypothetical protein n=1 Tax=Streptomyces sp. PR69 TaxID=2984950 RepID=UPI002264F184|nr:hypothetical protein [Streptomyces sp. PR69]